MPREKITQNDFVLAMHHVREMMRLRYGMRYSQEVVKYMPLLRKVMRQKNYLPGESAAFIVRDQQRAGEGKAQTPWLFAAAMEIVDEDARKVNISN